MRTLLLTDGSEFRLLEIFDNDFEFISAHIEESLYGDITRIEFRCLCDTKIVELLKKYKGYLKSKTGKKWEFECFCYQISYDNKYLEAKFMCSKIEFTRNIVTTKYTTIDNAIQSTWQLNRLDTVKTDLLSFDRDHFFYQMSETNYNLCTKLCFSYKYNTVFGYLLNGLKFIDLKAWKKEIELNDQVDIKLEQPASWTSGKLYESTVNIIDYNHSSPEYEIDSNHRIVGNYDQLLFCDTTYKDLIGNYLYNRRLKLMKQSNIFRLNYLPDFEVGTYVKINSTQIRYSNCFVSKRIINMEQSRLEIVIQIQSIE